MGKQWIEFSIGMAGLLLVIVLAVQYHSRVAQLTPTQQIHQHYLKATLSPYNAISLHANNVEDCSYLNNKNNTTMTVDEAIYCNEKKHAVMSAMDDKQDKIIKFCPALGC